eukprot:7317856-Pyramimonas_sp.AAC.1
MCRHSTSRSQRFPFGAVGLVLSVCRKATLNRPGQLQQVVSSRGHSISQYPSKAQAKKEAIFFDMPYKTNDISSQERACST